MKEIQLTNGGATIVDDEDYDTLMRWKWQRSSNGYAYRGSVGMFKHHAVYMHNVISGADCGLCTDHINGDRLDNRRCNLRIATRSQNAANKDKLEGTSSKYKGVMWHKRHGKWTAQIRVDYKLLSLGYFDDDRAAALAYNEAAAKHFGEFARLNVVD